jgi:hypothetical protein
MATEELVIEHLFGAFFDSGVSWPNTSTAVQFYEERHPELIRPRNEGGLMQGKFRISI